MVKKEDISISISDKIENLNNLLDEYKEEASKDIRVDSINFENNFNRNDLMLKWLDKSIIWKKTVDTSRDVLAKVVSELNEKYISESLYNISEKNLKAKVEANDKYQIYKKQYFHTEIVYDYCVRIMEILKAQQFEIKNRFEYLKFVNGLDK
jgi:hypothetical protein